MILLHFYNLTSEKVESGNDSYAYSMLFYKMFSVVHPVLMTLLIVFCKIATFTKEYYQFLIKKNYHLST